MSENTGSHYTDFREVKEGESVFVSKDGWTSNLGNVNRIFATHEDFIVWWDDKDEIWYEDGSKQVDSDPKFHDFWGAYQTVKTESLHNFSKEQAKAVKEMFASAIASALEKHFPAAEKLLEQARNFIDAHNERTAKKRYLAGVIGSATLALLVGTVLYLIYYYSQVDQTVQMLAQVMCGGAIGTILSASGGRIDGAHLDPNATKWEGCLNGAQRALYGVCGAFVAILALKSGLVFDSKCSMNPR